MKENESVFERLQKERDIAERRVWERKVKTRELSQGLKDLSFDLQGLPQRFVTTLSGVVETMSEEHISVKFTAAPHGFVVMLDPLRDEVIKNSLPGEEKYKDTHFILARIDRNWSIIGVSADTITAGQEVDWMMHELSGMLTELRKDGNMMRETTNAVIDVVLDTLKSGNEKVDHRDDPFSELISGLNLDDFK